MVAWIQWVEHVHQHVDAMLDTRMNPPVHEDRLDELLGGLLQVIGSETIRRWNSEAPGGVEIVGNRREVARNHRINGHRSAYPHRPPYERAFPRGRAPPGSRCSTLSIGSPYATTYRYPSSTGRLKAGPNTSNVLAEAGEIEKLLDRARREFSTL